MVDYMIHSKEANTAGAKLTMVSQPKRFDLPHSYLLRESKRDNELSFFPKDVNESTLEPLGEVGVLGEEACTNQERSAGSKK